MAQVINSRPETWLDNVAAQPIGQEDTSRILLGDDEKGNALEDTSGLPISNEASISRSTVGATRDAVSSANLHNNSNASGDNAATDTPATITLPASSDESPNTELQRSSNGGTSPSSVSSFGDSNAVDKRTGPTPQQAIQDPPQVATLVLFRGIYNTDEHISKVIDVANYTKIDLSFVITLPEGSSCRPIPRITLQQSSDGEMWRALSGVFNKPGAGGSTHPHAQQAFSNVFTRYVRVQVEALVGGYYSTNYGTCFGDEQEDPSPYELELLLRILP
ncbi:MAG: hypothetical protein LBM12_00460 [Candidatus Nomurabacteria bacterium]|nr:hypothetical protein [Candidatus Nomurabacteria bacterium]